ncbi:site-specific integrase [Phycisphaeraceae bacterium D3-23]
MAENTIRKSCGVAKQFFTAAVRSRLIPDNPFSDLPAIVKSNPDRYHYVTREDAASVIDACPNAEWRLLFALARYGGLRVPSETTRLRWADIDWDKNRFTVTSPKTEHHDGQGTRVVPIFPELLPFLRESFELAEPGQVYYLPTKRDSTANLRTQLLRIIGRASLEPWPKLWQNLRSTRETELADQYPAHVASKWIGNSVAVAAKHYLQVTEDHMAQAAQNAAQQLHETTGNGPKAIRTENHSAVVSAADCENLQEKTAPCELQEAVSDGPYWTEIEVATQQSRGHLVTLAS